MSDDENRCNDREANGHFAKGNKFWLARSSHGPKPKFASGEALWSACLEYFEWVEANPLQEAKPFAFQGKVTIANVNKMRAMTIGGLCNFLDITEVTWHEWARGKTDLSYVTTQAVAFIRQQKFEGASADLLNANIIARDLGLADKQELTGKDGGAIKVESPSERIAGRIAGLAARNNTQDDTE